MLRLLKRKIRQSREPIPLPSQVARRLYGTVVTQARLPVFYTQFGVPDTPDGRYDLIVLHAILVLRRLHADTGIDPRIGQALFDLVFTEFDESLREMGVGDLSVGKIVKALARGFYGRLAAYGTNLDASDADALATSLRRNVYRHSAADADTVAALAAYAFAVERQLAQITTPALLDRMPVLVSPCVSPGRHM